jgi:hypothetical protein
MVTSNDAYMVTANDRQKLSTCLVATAVQGTDLPERRELGFPGLSSSAQVGRFR